MEELKVIENEIVSVYETDKGEKVVYGTELYKVLEVKSKFADWVKNRLNDCDAIENKDFQSFSKILEKGGRPQTEYIIQLDTAKEMAMLERNDIGKQVRRYFIDVEKKYKEKKAEKNTISLKEQLEAAAFVAENLHIPQSNKIMMFRKVCENNNVNSNFLPAYSENEDREAKPATELLERFQCGISARKFNELLLKAGYLEERERKSSSSKTGMKKFKSLTEKGLKYGKNLTCEKNVKETQPYYYVDTFLELYHLVQGGGVMRENVTSKVEMEATLQSYRQQVREVKADMNWEDYFKLIEIATETNANNAVDLAWRLGYLAGIRFGKE